MKEEILDGSQPKKTKQIKEILLEYSIKVKNTVLSSLLDNIAKYLLVTLENYIKKAILPKNYQNGNADVYDLIDVEKTERFQAINGVIYHNCLGLSYNVGKDALARKLSQDMGEVITVEQAEQQIQNFKEAFPDFAEWNKTNKTNYFHGTRQIKMPDGWMIFTDCDNWRTVNNFPIQSMGACVMRRAVELCQDAGITILFTLHDALYAEFDDSNKHLIDVMFDCMHQAVVDLYPEEKKQYAALMRMEGEIWGPTLEKGIFVTPKGNKLESDTIHIDPRAKRDYEQFSKYFHEIYDPILKDL